MADNSRSSRTVCAQRSGETGTKRRMSRDISLYNADDIAQAIIAPSAIPENGEIVDEVDSSTDVTVQGRVFVPGGKTAECETEEDDSFTEDTMATTTMPQEESVEQYWAGYRKDPQNQEYRNRLVETYLPLVRYNAERIWQRLPEGVELDDLISAGVFGLMDAIDAFDLERGVKFETYCVPRIRGAMLDELRNMDWVPRLVRSKASKLNEAQRNLEAKFGRPATDLELAAEMQVSVTELEKLMADAAAVNLVSLNKKWYETDSYKDVREIDILEDKRSEDPTQRIQRADLMRLVTKGLNRNERLIIILYYYEEMTMKEIGMTLDLSESRVSQMHSAILQRLQSQLGRRRPEFGI